MAKTNQKYYCIIQGGIVQIVGESDVGKTSFGLENGYRPEQIIFVDDDVKGKATAKQMKNEGMNFASYIDFADRVRGKNMYEVYEEVIKVINEIKNICDKGGVKVVVWDTWQRAGDSFIEYVKVHPEKFVTQRKDGKFWSGNSQIITGTQYKFAALHEAAILNELQRITPLVILVSHTKKNYKAGVEAGVKAASSRTLNRIPYARFWLRRNPNSPIPIALVMKRVNKKYFDEECGGLRTVNILPQKIVPNVLLPEEDQSIKHNDKSLWDTIKRYYENPVGLRELMSCEIPNRDELAIISGTMTEEQQIGWKASISAMERQKEAEQAVKDSENKERAKQMNANGKSYVEISKELNIPLPKAIAYCS